MNPIEILSVASGGWRGTNTLQDPFSGKPEESATIACLTPVVGGRFVRLDYTWAYQGKPQEGSLLIGFDPEAGEVSGYWVDSWHMGRKGLNLVGKVGEGAIAMRGSYPAPTGPDWGWRIEVATEPLRIRHTNIEPDGTEDLAAEGVYERSGDVGPIGETDANALPG